MKFIFQSNALLKMLYRRKKDKLRHLHDTVNFLYIFLQIILNLFQSCLTTLKSTGTHNVSNFITYVSTTDGDVDSFSAFQKIAYGSQIGNIGYLNHFTENSALQLSNRAKTYLGLNLKLLHQLYLIYTFRYKMLVF